MGKLGWNSGYIGSDQRDTAVGAVGYGKYYLERLDGRFNPLIGSLLLDTYTGAAAAYSLRKLTDLYTGNAIRVRRSSDNTEQDIGFSNSILDTTSLLSFVGAGNGFVTTWYDQSGNGYHSIQTNAVNQPTIVTGSTVVVENGKPAITLVSEQKFLATTINRANPAAPTSWFITYRLKSLVRQGIFSWANSNTDGINFEPGADGPGLSIHEYGGYAYGPNSSDWWSTTQDLFSWISPGGLVSLSSLYLNSSLAPSVFKFGSNGNIIVNGNVWIGKGSAAATSGVESNIQEVVLYNADQSSNRTGIETNINNFYSIY